MSRPRVFPRNGDRCINVGCGGDHFRAGYCVACYFRARRANGKSLWGQRAAWAAPAVEEMTPRELETIGLRRYGDGWYASMALALGVSPRTIRRWHLGWTPVSLKAAAAVRGLVAPAPNVAPAMAVLDPAQGMALFDAFRRGLD